MRSAHSDVDADVDLVRIAEGAVARHDDAMAAVEVVAGEDAVDELRCLVFLVRLCDGDGHVDAVARMSEATDERVRVIRVRDGLGAALGGCDCHGHGYSIA